MSFTSLLLPKTQFNKLLLGASHSHNSKSGIASLDLSTPEADEKDPNFTLIKQLGVFEVSKETMGEEDDSIEQAAASRRERLRALKAAQELLSTSEDGSAQVDDKTNDENEATEEQNTMKFRNYVPHDKDLQEGKIAPAVLPKFEDPVAAAPPPEKEDPFLNIAPKKPNWDLHRDVQKKLDKLEKRTQKALFKLMEEQEKQKLLTEGDDTNGTAD